MCSLVFLLILTSIFKSSLNELKDNKQGIFGREPPLPIKTLPVFSMAADSFYEDCLCNESFCKIHMRLKRRPQLLWSVLSPE